MHYTTPMMCDEAPSHVASVQAARRAAKEATKIEAKLDAWGEDVHEDGSVITFTIQFEEEGPEYNYAFLRAADRWYSTAALGRGRSLSWDDLVAFAVENEVTPEAATKATGWEPLG